MGTKNLDLFPSYCMSKSGRISWFSVIASNIGIMEISIFYKNIFEQGRYLVV